MMPPNRGAGGGSSSTSRTTTTRSPPYYTTPRPLLTTSPGQRYRTTTTVRSSIQISAGGSSSDSNQIPDTNQKAGGRSPPVQVLPAAPQPPALPPQDFCSPRVTADISWPRTQQGQTAKQPCPVGTLGEEAAWELKCLWLCTTVILEKIQTISKPLPGLLYPSAGDAQSVSTHTATKNKKKESPLTPRKNL